MPIDAVSVLRSPRAGRAAVSRDDAGQVLGAKALLDDRAVHVLRVGCEKLGDVERGSAEVIENRAALKKGGRWAAFFKDVLGAPV